MVFITQRQCPSCRRLLLGRLENRRRLHLRCNQSAACSVVVAVPIVGPGHSSSAVGAIIHAAAWKRDA